MNLSASIVKELREKSGAGMMDCKKALIATNGIVEDAIDWLRKQGLSAVAKKSDRVAAEGLIGITIKGTKGALIEVNSETDFVARNELFQNFVKTCSQLALESKSDINFLKTLLLPNTDKTVNQELTNNIATIGENMNIRRAEYLEVSEGILVPYIHNKVTDDLGKLGVIVAIETKANDKQIIETGKKIAMHIAATSPKSLNINDLNKDLVDREKNVFMDQAIASGKPVEIAEIMVQGRMQKFFKDVVLNEQIFVIDGESKIKDIVRDLSENVGTQVVIKDFKILKLGEGIEVIESDFASEVAATASMN